MHEARDEIDDLPPFLTKGRGKSTPEAIDSLNFRPDPIPYTTLSRNRTNFHALEADFMVLLGCLVFSGFFRVDLLRAAAENTALVIVVMELGAVGADAIAHPQENFCSNQHAQSRGEEIDPKGMPVAASNCRAKRSRGIHAHSGEGRFERDKNRIKCANKIRRVAREFFVIRCEQNGQH